MLNRLILPITLFLLVIIYGCTNQRTVGFDEGVKKINEFDKQFGATMKTPPNSTEGVDGLLAQLVGFRAANMDVDKSLATFLDFRIKNLEAERLHIEGWQWGKGSTTDYGFGCNKGSERVINSSRIRNASAQKGYEAVEALQSFIGNYPKEAESLNLTQKDALFLNAAYLQIEEKANRDYRIIISLCKEQVESLRKEGVI
ncbi:hypothetical protein HYW19_02290 [Candidatus Woesearchaeota archaeon]|nr:hypothetical protein [Candidatus Woesearchaeota archaeon]